MAEKLVPVEVWVCSKCGHKIRTDEVVSWRRKPGVCPECGGVMRKTVVLR